MSYEESHSFNEDANETLFCSTCGSMIHSNVSSNVMNGQEHFSLYSDQSTAATMQPIPISTTVSAEMIQLQSELQIQRLRNQISEEKIQHLLKIKELSQRMTTPIASVEPVIPLSRSFMNNPNEVESIEKLLAQLEAQRIQQQIEENDILHKIKMKQLQREAET